jgi:hypothetical protein
MTQPRIRAGVHPGFKLRHWLVPAGGKPGSERLTMGRWPQRGDADEIEASLMGDSLDLLGELPALSEHCEWCHGSLHSLVHFRHVASLYKLRKALYAVLHSLPIFRRSPDAR